MKKNIEYAIMTMVVILCAACHGPTEPSTCETIFFTNGNSEKCVYLRFEKDSDEFAYGTHPKNTSHTRARFSAIKEIVLEPNLLASGHPTLIGPVRKAKILFRDGGERSGIYLQARAFEWKSKNQEGDLNDVSIARIVTWRGKSNSDSSG